MALEAQRSRRAGPYHLVSTKRLSSTKSSASEKIASAHVVAQIFRHMVPPPRPSAQPPASPRRRDMEHDSSSTRLFGSDALAIFSNKRSGRQIFAASLTEPDEAGIWRGAVRLLACLGCSMLSGMVCFLVCSVRGKRTCSTGLEHRLVYFRRFISHRRSQCPKDDITRLCRACFV